MSMISLVALMLLVTVDVIMRRALNSPIYGSYEIEKFMLTIVVFMVLAYIMSNKGHIVVNTFTSSFPPRLRRVATSLGYLLTLIIIGLICWGSVIYGVDMVKAGEKSLLLPIPVAPFIFIAAYGSAILFLATLFHFLYILAGVEKKDTSTTCTL